MPALLASGAANIRGVEFDLASDSFVAIDQRRFLPDPPIQERKTIQLRAAAFNLPNHLNPSTPNTSPLSSGNNGLYRIIQMAVKFAF